MRGNEEENRRAAEAAVRKEGEKRRNETGIRKENLLNEVSTPGKNMLENSQKIVAIFR